MPTFLISWQLNLIPLGSFRVLMPIFLNSAATKPGHLDHSGFSCRLFLNSAATKPGHLDHSGFSCRTFLNSTGFPMTTKPRSLPDPPGSHANLSLLITEISRHDARLSSTTHRALCASIYSATTWPTCRDVFLSCYFPIWTYAAPCRPAHLNLDTFNNS